MSERGHEFNDKQVRELLQELSDRLADRGESAQLFVVGGAALALVYDPARLTRDIDAFMQPAGSVRAVAADIARTRGLESDWLNDGAKGFLPGSDSSARVVFESEALLVTVPSPEYLLALKLHASRGERDLDDAAKLFNIVGYTSADQARDLLARTYPASQLLPRHRYVVEDVASRARDLARDRSVARGGQRKSAAEYLPNARSARADRSVQADKPDSSPSTGRQGRGRR